MNRFYLLVVALAFFAAGCSSSKKTSEKEAPYYLGAFEDFDADQYEDVTPPVDTVKTEHDIPAKLQTRAGVAASLIRGFRVQLFSSLSRSEANDAMQKAITWWEDRTDRKEARPPIYMEYEQPYYKVRAGNFKSKAAASKMAGSLSRVFAGAFIVPSLIESGR
ncbi:MAG: SPOR domain-containing protein [Rhodothermales bacterium]